MFWDHSKQHSSKTLRAIHTSLYSFGTIRNNTALKLYKLRKKRRGGFGTIRNNTALKHSRP